MRPNKPVALLALTLLLTGIGGCIYRMPIQQGNFLDADQVAQLQQGMTRSQVAFLLGTPMVPTAFDTDRWDYYYYTRNSRLQKPQTRRLTVYFQNDMVSRIERENESEAGPAG